MQPTNKTEAEDTPVGVEYALSLSLFHSPFTDDETFELRLGLHTLLELKVSLFVFRLCSFLVFSSHISHERYEPQAKSG